MCVKENPDRKKSQLYISYIQKQPHRGVPRKRCSENMQQIYRRTPTPKCDFNKVALRHGCSLNLLHIFRTPFLKNTSGWLLLYISIISGTMKEHNDKICKEQVVEGGWRNLVLDWNGNWVAGAGRRQPYINPCQICCKPLNDKKCEAHDLQGLFENIFYMNFDFIFLLKA